MEEIYLGQEIPENVKEEISLLYGLGVEIEELEYLIKIKLKESLSLRY